MLREKSTMVIIARYKKSKVNKQYQNWFLNLEKYFYSTPSITDPKRRRNIWTSPKLQVYDLTSARKSMREAIHFFILLQNNFLHNSTTCKLFKQSKTFAKRSTL